MTHIVEGAAQPNFLKVILLENGSTLCGNVLHLQNREPEVKKLLNPITSFI